MTTDGKNWKRVTIDECTYADPVGYGCDGVHAFTANRNGEMAVRFYSEPEGHDAVLRQYRLKAGNCYKLQREPFGEGLNMMLGCEL